MYSEHDEGHGLVKTNWNKVRERVHKVNPEFASLIDEVSPGDDMPLFLAYYPYGHLRGDDKHEFLPTMDNNYYYLNEAECPKEIFQHLGYGTNAAPLGLILEKSFEFFYNDPRNSFVTVPITVMNPGYIYPASLFLKKSNRVYSSNATFLASSGARSTFMLANIYNTENLRNLEKKYNCTLPQPKKPYDQHKLFTMLNNQLPNDKKWTACVINFSNIFLKKILEDDAWIKIRTYLLQSALERFSYYTNSFYHRTMFSRILQENNLRMNPQNFDTLKHVIRVALGIVPGYVPLTNDEFMPVSFLQKTFVENYGLTNYIPTIIGPKMFKFENEKKPIYFPLQYITEELYSPTSRTSTSTLSELRELARALGIFQKELGSKAGLGHDTSFADLMKSIGFTYFHNSNDNQNTTISSKNIENYDSRFTSGFRAAVNSNAKTNIDAKFFKGCIGIKPKDNI